MERSRSISDLRDKGELSEEFLVAIKGLKPNVATLIKNLTSRDPENRPSSSYLLKNIFTKDKTEKIEMEEENKNLRLKLLEKEKVIEKLQKDNENLKAIIGVLPNNPTE